MSGEAVYWVVPVVSPNNAGYRVRTLPLAKALEEFSITPRVIPVKEFIASIESIANEAAVVIVAKPSDTVMFLSMKYLASRGVVVLADLFDNYFSWSRVLHKRGLHWQWLRAVDPEACSGVITSTPYLADVLRHIGVRDVCEISDLAPGEAPGDAAAGMGLSEKWRDPEQIELLWYGISGNPYFCVGLDDLASWLRVVTRIRDRLNGHRRMRLTICTNRDPAVGGVLKSFAGEGIDTRYVPWTAEVCDELLQASHLVLLPSNLSGFSLSKTHNRCSDALWRHSLVLASPNGPYRALNGAVYRDVRELCGDLVAADPARITAKLRASIAEISGTYSKSEHAANLARFISANKRGQGSGHESAPGPLPKLLSKLTSSLKGRDSGPDASKVLVLGHFIIPDSVAWARKLGYLSASFEGLHRNDPVDFEFKSAGSAAGKIRIRMSDAGRAALDKVLPRWIGRRRADIKIETIGETHTLTMTLPALRPLLETAALVAAIDNPHPNLRQPQHDAHVRIIIIALQALGFRNFDYSTEAASGWESYAALAAPRLQKAAHDLVKTWRQFQGNEHEIGRLPSTRIASGETVNA